MSWIIIILSLISPLLSLTKVSVGNKTFILHTENGDCYENSTIISGGDLDKKTEITGVENAFHCLGKVSRKEHEQPPTKIIPEGAVLGLYNPLKLMGALLPGLRTLDPPTGPPLT